MTNPDQHYLLHKLALQPVLDNEFDFRQINLNDIDFQEFADFICHQRLAGIWLDALHKIPDADQYEEFKQALVRICKFNAACELPQRRVMEEAHEILTSANIPYFFAKGVQLREMVYDQPWLRPAHDIDIFVSAGHQNDAIRLFQEGGFKANPRPETLTHEIKLSKYNCDVDLHWHLMRPSRYRPHLDHWLFQHTEKFGEYWGLDATASLLVMLTHPPITKYLISPSSMLIHQVDQLKLIQNKKIDWPVLEQALGESGLKTAAWSSLYLQYRLTNTLVNHEFMQSIQPGRLKMDYLRYWIDKAWISRFFDQRWLVSSCFNLMLQDNAKDIIKAAMHKGLSSMR